MKKKPVKKECCKETDIIAEEFYNFIVRCRKKTDCEGDDYPAYLAMSISMSILYDLIPRKRVDEIIKESQMKAKVGT